MIDLILTVSAHPIASVVAMIWVSVTIETVTVNVIHAIRSPRATERQRSGE